jgi:hypothetical protein
MFPESQRIQGRDHKLFVFNVHLTLVHSLYKYCKKQNGGQSEVLVSIDAVALAFVFDIFWYRIIY